MTAHSAEPASILTTKDSWFWTAAWIGLLVLVTVLSLGIGTRSFLKKLSLKTYLENVATTLGPVQSYPREYVALMKRLIVHDARHTWQCIVLSLIVPILGWIPHRRFRACIGLLPFGIVYGLLPFPIFLCYGRYKLELDAEKSSWRWMLRNGYSVEKVRVRAEDSAKKVSGAKYLWSWPASLVRRGFRIEVKKVIRKYIEDTSAT